MHAPGQQHMLQCQTVQNRYSEQRIFPLSPSSLGPGYATDRGPRPLELVDSSPPFTGEVLCRDGRSELLLKAQMESSGHRGGIGFNRTPIQSMLSSELTGIGALYRDSVDRGIASRAGF
jgi:hypothetical protein